MKIPRIDDASRKKLYRAIGSVWFVFGPQVCLRPTTARTAPAGGGSPERPKRSGGPALRVDALQGGVVRRP